MSDKYTFDIHSGILLRYHGEADKIKIPSGVTKIGKAAFAKSSVQEIFLPEGLSQIGEQAFDSCENLRYVHFPESLTEIAEGAFGHCRSLRDVRLFEGLQVLGRYAFFKCKSLDRIELPDTLSEIGDEAFGYCTALREIVLPKHLKFIGRYILGGCDSLDSITYPINTTLMKKIVLTTQNMIRITIPEGVTRIEFGIIQANENTREIMLPKSLEYIENHAFSDCPVLRSISFPNGTSESMRGFRSLQIFNSPALVLDDYIFGKHSLFFGPSFDDYDVAVLAGFLSRLCENLEFNINSHKANLSRILRHANADISRKELGANTLGGLLRLAILKKRGLESAEAIDMILKSGIFSKDAEVMTKLIEQKRKLVLSSDQDDLTLE